MNEHHLIRQIILKERNAFAALVELYKERVYNTALGLIQNHEEAEDISQEVFIEVHQSISKFRNDSKLSTWIYRITLQKSLEIIRRKGRKKRAGTLLSLFGREHMVQTPATTPFYHPGVKLENKERSAILFSAIARLPENQRTAFTLHKVEDLSYHEIAGIMEVSLASVESLMFRAKQNLKKLLADYYKKNEQ